MGVPTSEVGYTPAMPRREDHEVHKGHVVALGEKHYWFRENPLNHTDTFYFIIQTYKCMKFLQDVQFHMRSSNIAILNSSEQHTAHCIHS